MSPRKKLRELVNGKRYVIVPGAYDPLTACLVTARWRELERKYMAAE